MTARVGRFIVMLVGSWRRSPKTWGCKDRNERYSAGKAISYFMHNVKLTLKRFTLLLGFNAMSALKTSALA